MKTKQILLILVGVLSLFAIIFFATFWYKFTTFYKDCTKIKVGMTVPDADSILRPYMNSDRFTVSTEIPLLGTGLYVASNSTGNSCGFATEDNKVSEVYLYFE